MGSPKYLIYSIFLAPSVSPTSVSIFDTNATNITVQWGPVDCIHRNGEITGYSVQYGVQGSGKREIISVSGATTSITISELDSVTIYSIQVAGVNNAGIGVYSASITALTQGTLVMI